MSLSCNVNKNALFFQAFWCIMSPMSFTYRLFFCDPFPVTLSFFKKKTHGFVLHQLHLQPRPHVPSFEPLQLFSAEQFGPPEIDIRTIRKRLLKELDLSICIYTHKIHVWYITYIYHKNQPNVHGSYGIYWTLPPSCKSPQRW